MNIDEIESLRTAINLFKDKYEYHTNRYKISNEDSKE